MRRPLVIYDFATRSVVDFLIYEENLIFFFISVASFLLESSNVPVVHCAAVLALPTSLLLLASLLSTSLLLLMFPPYLASLLFQLSLVLLSGLHLMCSYRC